MGNLGSETERPGLPMAQLVQGWMRGLEKEDLDIREANLTPQDWESWNKFRSWKAQKKDPKNGTLRQFLEEELGLKRSIQEKAWGEFVKSLPGVRSGVGKEAADLAEDWRLWLYSQDLVSEEEAWQLRARVIAGEEDLEILTPFGPSAGEYDAFFNQIVSHLNMGELTDEEWESRAAKVRNGGRIIFGRETIAGPRIGIVSAHEVWWVTDRVSNLLLKERLLDSPELSRFFLAQSIVKEQRLLVQKVSEEVRRLANLKNKEIDEQTEEVADQYRETALQLLFGLTDQGKTINLIRIYGDEKEAVYRTKEAEDWEGETMMYGERYLVTPVAPGKMGITKIECQGQEKLIRVGEGVVVTDGEGCEDGYFLDDFLTVFVPSDLRKMVSEGQEIEASDPESLLDLVDEINQRSREVTVLCEITGEGRLPWLQLAAHANYPGMRQAPTN